MAIATVRRLSLLCAALMSTTALTLVGTAQAPSKVGVTSATDGDPLGKPPMENERVLRIGIDVQANEVVRTGATDRAHLVFLDGTSLTVGPNARLTIDKFVYDPDAKKGDLAITATQGVFRLVGGKISKSNAITVTTPSSTIGIRGGITIFKVTASETVAAFIFGSSLTVTGAGQTQTVTRPGYRSWSMPASAPGAPTGIPKGGLAFDIGALETGNDAERGRRQCGPARAEIRLLGPEFRPDRLRASSRPSNPRAPDNNAITNATTNAVSKRPRPKPGHRRPSPAGPTAATARQTTQVAERLRQRARHHRQRQRRSRRPYRSWAAQRTSRVRFDDPDDAGSAR